MSRMIRRMRKTAKVVGRHIDEMPVDRQGNLFSVIISVVAIAVIVRTALF